MVASIQFSGLASGIDTASMIKQLVQLERLPINRIQERQSDLKTQQAKFNDLKNLLNTVRDKAKALDETKEIITTSVSVGDDKIVKATTTGDPAIGRYAISVTSLATSERTYSNTFNSKVAGGLFGSGTVSIQVGSETAVNIDVTATDSLESVAAKINSSNASVTAGVIFDGTNYRLQVAGKNTGDDNQIEFTETGTSLGLDVPANQLQAAGNASFSIDGLAMTSHTNTVKDAIAGITLDLIKDNSSTTVEVQRDPAKLEASLKEFVDGYNSVQKKINGEFSFTGQARGPESLVGDSTLRGVQSRMRTLAGSSIEGLTGKYTTLASIGIASTNDGTLKIDSTKLKEALADDAEAVARILTGDSTNNVTGLMSQFQTTIKGFTDSPNGSVVARIKGIDRRMKDYSSQIDAMERRVDTYETRLTAQFSAMERLVSGIQSQGQQMNAVLGR